jgi:peptide/nickel transport system permease protein
MSATSPAREDPLWRQLLRSRRVVLGGGWLLLLVVLALFAGWIAPHDPLDQDIVNGFKQPFWSPKAEPGFLLGTDNLGRDVLSRLIHGTQVALIVAVVAAAAAAAIGTTLGLLAGYYGGKVDMVVSRLVEVWMAFPAVLLAIVLVAVIGASLLAVIVAVAVIDWTRFCRVVRAETMVQKEQDYVASAVTIGLGRGRILVREILPNVVTPLLVEAAVAFAYAVLLESALSFLGLGAQPPEPSWGNMLNTGRGFMAQAPWLGIVPGMAMFLCLLGFNLLGDGLRDFFDPHLRD